MKTDSSMDKPIRILIVDDEPIFHKLIGTQAETLGYTWESANSLEQALLAIKDAEENDKPFSVVTIDMKFEIGKGEMRMGKMILQKIKSEYENIACIVISGSGLTPHEVLDLRDNYSLDYYISKDRLDQDTLDNGIKRALGRVKPVEGPEKRRQILDNTLATYQHICVIYANNLARIEEKKALKGIEAGVDLDNQIELYEQKLTEAQNKIQEITKELAQLDLAAE